MSSFGPILFVMLLIADGASRTASSAEPSATPDERWRLGELLFQDDFDHGLTQWSAELEHGGKVEVHDSKLIMDVPAGCTLWFRPFLDGPVLIEYRATVIAKGGVNDRLSDLNCFWMARDARNPKDIFAVKRTGKFEDYDQLRCYYVGLGANRNTTTRFRRYLGEIGNRPLRPEDDLRDHDSLLVPNSPQTLRLVAVGSLIQFFRDDRRLFEMMDGEPYTSGWFAFRTVTSHLEIEHFRVHRLRLVNGSLPSKPN
ncbi:MAG: hypothetical protein QOD99_1330 [Chthoniobacter sp.]|nr:hypothetical protein [Chthoniobacter sp.]